MITDEMTAEQASTDDAVSDGADGDGASGHEFAIDHRHARWADVLGVLWVIIAAFVALIPTYLRGKYIGSFDDLSNYGLSTQHGVHIHSAVLQDVGDEIVPWIQMVWTQVHAGHLPLWNRYEVLGMPLLFNWQSGAFSLAGLVSYLVPLKAVFWTQIMVSLVVGGTGAYFFGRVMRLHPIACAFAGTTWVLSGPFFGYLGLPDTSTMAFAGWTFGATVLILRGQRRYWSVALFAVSITFSILAGNPQIELLILLPFVVFVLVALLCRLPALRGEGPIRRPVVDLVLGFVAGAALTTPVSLPGFQLARAAVRNASPLGEANPVSQVLGTVFQTFWGLPLRGSSFVEAQGFYQEQWVWVGALAVSLAVVAVGVRWRRPEVVGLAAATLVACAVSVSGPLDSLLNDLPVVGHSWWSRSLIPLAFLLAMLGAIGLDTVLRSAERARATRWALGCFGVLAVLVGLVWLFARGDLRAAAAHERAMSFVWPVVSIAVGLAAFGSLALIDRRSGAKRWDTGRLRWLCLGVTGSILVCQTVFLVVLDGPLPSSSSTPYQPTAAVTELQRAVGSSLVGLGQGKMTFAGGLGLGLAPNDNIPFGIHQFAEYDPIAPASLFNSWYNANASSPGLEAVYIFIPAVDSATVARRYGIQYVLEMHGAPGPTGAVFDRRIGNEDLYRVPGAAAATLVAAPASVAWPSIDAPGTAVPVKWPTPSKLQVTTDSDTAKVLRLRLTNVPGWHATIDGQPLALSPYLDTMFQARIPPGKHVIELSYWPRGFTEGIVIASATVVIFAIVGVVGRRRRGSREPDPTAVA